MGELVSVIVPAFNAAAFVAEALDSALAQTYRKLEVVVVDDGSTDNTAEIVEAVSFRDSRVRLLRQKNRGVSAARNLAVSQSRGTLLAPLDADDLWHPEKIAKQVAAMQAGGPRVGMVYAWSSLIDESGRVLLRDGHVALHEGNVFPFLVSYNFIGNGSSPLLRRDYVLDVGGYDTTLRARGGECEDLMLYLGIAERYDVLLVPALLVGYRVSSTNLSSNVDRMKRGHELVLETIRSRHLDLPEQLYRWSRAFNYTYLGRRSLHLGRSFSAAWFFGCALAQDPALLFEPPFWRALGRLGSRFAADSDRVNRVGSTMSKFLDLPLRPDSVAQREIEDFSRRRHAFLMNLAKRDRSEVMQRPIRLTEQRTVRRPVALAQVGPARSDRVERSL